MTLSPDNLIQQISNTIDPAFARAAVESFIDMEQRFLAGDWQPAELDGGRLCEAVSQALLQMDTGRIDHNASVADVRQKLDNPNINHNLDKPERTHISKAIEAVYKMRSQRGPVHISPNYSPNAMDAMYVLHAGKWIFAEFLRLVWSQDRDVIARVIEQLVQVEHSLVFEVDGKPIVMAIGMTSGDEILVLLFHALDKRASRVNLAAQASRHQRAAINKAITTLHNRREIHIAENGDIVLTPLGTKRIREVIMPKYHPKSA